MNLNEFELGMRVYRLDAWTSQGMVGIPICGTVTAMMEGPAECQHRIGVDWDSGAFGPGSLSPAVLAPMGELKADPRFKVVKSVPDDVAAEWGRRLLGQPNPLGKPLTVKALENAAKLIERLKVNPVPQSVRGRMPALQKLQKALGVDPAPKRLVSQFHGLAVLQDYRVPSDEIHIVFSDGARQVFKVPRVSNAGQEDLNACRCTYQIDPKAGGFTQCNPEDDWVLPVCMVRDGRTWPKAQPQCTSLPKKRDCMKFYSLPGSKMACCREWGHEGLCR